MKKIIFSLLFCCIGFLSFGQGSNTFVQADTNYFIWLKPQVLSDSTIELNVVNPTNNQSLLNETTAEFPRGLINFNPALRFEKDTASVGNDSTETTPKHYYIVLDSLQSADDMITTDKSSIIATGRKRV